LPACSAPAPATCRGKLLNVRDASAAQITGNAEIQSIKQILGLQHGKVYTDAKSLRYGHLMIMTDQVGGWVVCVRRKGAAC
jgi:DNA gyrase/topoisomerase IV subunit B